MTEQTQSIYNIMSNDTEYSVIQITDSKTTPTYPITQFVNVNEIPRKLMEGVIEKKTESQLVTTINGNLLQRTLTPIDPGSTPAMVVSRHYHIIGDILIVVGTDYSCVNTEEFNFTDNPSIDTTSFADTNYSLTILNLSVSGNKDFRRLLCNKRMNSFNLQRSAQPGNSINITKLGDDIKMFTFMAIGRNHQGVKTMNTTPVRLATISNHATPVIGNDNLMNHLHYDQRVLFSADVGNASISNQRSQFLIMGFHYCFLYGKISLNPNAEELTLDCPEHFPDLSSFDYVDAFIRSGLFTLNNTVSDIYTYEYGVRGSELTLKLSPPSSTTSNSATTVNYLIRLAILN